jgi:hypothetical protein
VRTAVEYIVREGVCASAPEAVQLLVARELLTVLGAVANLATPGLGFQPLLNEHQLQVLQGVTFSNSEVVMLTVLQFMHLHDYLILVCTFPYG